MSTAVRYYILGVREASSNVTTHNDSAAYERGRAFGQFVLGLVPARLTRWLA